MSEEVKNVDSPITAEERDAWIANLSDEHKAELRRLQLLQAAIAKVQPALDGAVVGLPPDLEPPPRVSAIERLVVNPACHCCSLFSPLLDTLLRVPSDVQYTWWNDRKRLGTRM